MFSCLVHAKYNPNMYCTYMITKCLFVLYLTLCIILLFGLRPHVSIIGSREQMCINSEVMNKESNSEKVHLCRAKVQSKTCGYYNNLDSEKHNSETDRQTDR